MAYTRAIQRKKGARHRGFYRTADGRYKSAGTYDSEERALEVAQAAEKHAAELVRGAVGQLDPVVRATRTIQEYEPIFMRHHWVEGNTKDTYADTLRLHVIPFIGDVRLAEMTRMAARNYFTALEEAGILGMLADADDAASSCTDVAEISERTTTALLKALGWHGTIRRSSNIAARTGRSERLADLASEVSATAYLCGTGGTRYLDKAPFIAQELAVRLFTPRLAALPPDARHRATALTDLAKAGPQTLARHLYSHATAWRDASPATRPWI